ncbi:MAG: 3-oxoacyl-[acyl-carrier protein] reductase [Abditibacteriota bacterium]|jgi:3-oxoacyl-[acyl-carrier protein] reductase|nr:3-oxoacyl-[acyl-carrier protein] reductase [Abditibacteriota bacterium]
MLLSEKTALITGASRGIGRAVALRLAREGARVLVHFNRDQSAAQSVVQEIEGAGGRALAVSANLSEISAVRALFAQLPDAYAQLDIVVNNAGAASFAPLPEVSVDEFDALFNLNVRGLFFVTQEAVLRLNDGGRIINISSGITRVNAAGGSVYAATKSAVEAFTRCWAAELGARRITVNTVSPGMTETDLMREVVPPQALEGIVAQTLLGRLGQPDDIADVVAFLCSDQARWLTAQNLLANGGAT